MVIKLCGNRILSYLQGKYLELVMGMLVIKVVELLADGR